MTIRTGLLHVCAALTALWVLGAVGVLDLSGLLRATSQQPVSAALASDQLSETVASRPGRAQETSEADRRYQAERRANRFKRFLIVAALVYIPPFALLLVGTLIAWIGRHLRSV